MRAFVFGVGAFAAGLVLTLIIVLAFGAITGVGMGSCGPYGPDWALSVETILLFLGPFVSLFAGLLVGARMKESRAEPGDGRE